MKNILIVGAGGFGREVFVFANHCIASGENWHIKGFLDDNKDALKNLKYPVEIVSGISDYAPEPDELCLVAIANPKIKKQVVADLRSRGAKFATLIHPTSIVGHNVEISEGVIVCPFVSIPCDSKIGEFTHINTNCTIAHDSELGAYTTLSAGCDITGYTTLGEGVFFASNVACVPNSKVGDWASVGINSFVISKLKGGESYLGNPARPI